MKQVRKFDSGSGSDSNSVDVEVFLTAREVEDSLAGRDLSKCLAWCHENRSRLRKLKSSLEFQVRVRDRDRSCHNNIKP